MFFKRRLLLIVLLCLFAAPLHAQLAENKWQMVARLGYGAVQAAAWRPDSRLFALGSASGVRVYDLALTEIGAWDAGDVTGLAWHPTGKLLAVSHADGITLWDIADLAAPERLKTLPNGQAPLAWSPDGAALAFADAAAQIHVWDAATQRDSTLFRGHRQPTPEQSSTVLDLQWSPDSALIASTGSSTPLYIWSAATGDIQNSMNGARGVPLWQDAWLHWDTADTLHVLDWHNDNRPMQHWLDATHLTSQPIALPTDNMAGAFAPDDSTLLTFDPFQTARLYRVANNALELLQQAHVSGASDAQAIELRGGVLYSPNGDYALTTSIATAALWRVSAGGMAQVGRIEGYNGVLNDIAWSPDGATLAAGYGDITAGGSDARLRVWDVATRQLSWQAEWQIAPVLSLAWRDDGQFLATGHYGGGCALRLWDVNMQHSAACGAATMLAAETLSWQPNSATLTALHEGSLSFWDTTADAFEVYQPPTGESVAVAGMQAWSPDGTTLASIYYPEYEGVILWRRASGHVLTLAGSAVYMHNARGNFNPYALVVVWSPDGRYIALAEGRIGLNAPRNLAMNATISLYDATTGERVRQFTGHRGGVTALAWSPDSTHLLSGSRDGTARLWDIQQTRPLTTLFENADPLIDVAWSPDGQMLALGTTTGALYLFAPES